MRRNDELDKIYFRQFTVHGSKTSPGSHANDVAVRPTNILMDHHKLSFRVSTMRSQSCHMSAISKDNTLTKCVVVVDEDA